jgi:uncharacterized protein
VIIPDVNVWIYAIRPDLDGHSRYRDWLTAAVASDEPVGVSELILSGVVRILSNRRIFEQPSTASSVLTLLDVIKSAPGTRVVAPGERHWGIFADLCTVTSAAGNLVADAYHAALAIEHNATFATADRDFARFPGLVTAHPLD